MRRRKNPAAFRLPRKTLGKITPFCLHVLFIGTSEERPKAIWNCQVSLIHPQPLKCNSIDSLPSKTAGNYGTLQSHSAGKEKKWTGERRGISLEGCPQPDQAELAGPLGGPGIYSEKKGAIGGSVQRQDIIWFTYWKDPFDFPWGLDCNGEQEDAGRKTFSNYSWGGGNANTNSLLLGKSVSYSLNARLAFINIWLSF